MDQCCKLLGVLTGPMAIYSGRPELLPILQLPTRFPISEIHYFLIHSTVMASAIKLHTANIACNKYLSWSRPLPSSESESPNHTTLRILMSQTILGTIFLGRGSGCFLLPAFVAACWSWMGGCGWLLCNIN